MTAAARTRSFEELYAEIQALPEGSQGEILTPGEVHITMGRPGKAQRRAAKRIQEDLRASDQELGGTGWWLASEPEARIGPRVFNADMAGWRIERVAEMPDEQPINIVPDWVCEILSPSTMRTDLRTKLPPFDLDVRPLQWWLPENAPQPVPSEG